MLQRTALPVAALMVESNPAVSSPGLTDLIKFVKPAPIDQEATKKAKKQQGGGKKKKQEAGDGSLPDAMESMSVN